MTTRLVPALDLGWLYLETKDTPNHVGALMIFELPANAGPTYMRDLTDSALVEMQLGVAHYVSNARAHDAALAIHGASPN